MSEARRKQTRRRRKKRLAEEPVEAHIESLSAEGRGITHIENRPVFIDQALAGERVLFKYTKRTQKIAEGIVTEVLQASPDRVAPECVAYKACGGCSLQHMAPESQIKLKQQTLLDHLQYIGKVQPENILQPLMGPLWGYRSKARLGVRYVPKKGKALVGFRERASSFITDTEQCEILHTNVGSVIKELSDCISQMELKQRIPQIEVAVGDNQSVLVVRHLDPMPEQDRDLLRSFSRLHDLVIYLQSGAPDKLEPLWPLQPEKLFYELASYNVRIEFEPSDFTQVNPALNRSMIECVLNFLELKENDHVLDLFCGLGNFSLPMARKCAQVTGVEGAHAMVIKARDNALLNNITNAEFILADLYNKEDITAPWLKKQYNKILLDPPRSGAAIILEHLKKMQAQKIVYVSCHPATLARDAGVLVNTLGYKLTHAGVMDMFPHTAHVESIAVFEK